MKKFLVLLLLICSSAWASGYQQIESLMTGIIGTDGAQLAGGKVYAYLPGTTTLTTIYQDSSGATAHANPLTLDVNGRALAFTNRTVRLKITDADGVLVADLDNLVYGTGYTRRYVESFTSGAGMTGFYLSGTYATATSILNVFIDGVRQASGTFTWTPPAVVLDAPIPVAGCSVEAEIWSQ